MAVSLDNLIDLNLLSHYDSNLKSWVQDQIDNEAEFEVTTELPEEGVEGKLYFTNDNIYVYTAEEGYQPVGNSGSTSNTWNNF